MPLIRIQRFPGVRQVFIATEEISHLAVIAINETGPRYVELGTNADQALVCGVAYGSVSGIVSGQAIRAVTEGIVSGVAIAVDINAGDRVACASAGKIAPLNTITPVGSISGGVLGFTSGLIAAGATGFFSGRITSGVLSGVASGFSPLLSGAVALDEIYISGAVAGSFSGAIIGTSFNTARVLGKALASGFVLSGHTVPVLVTLGG